MQFSIKQLLVVTLFAAIFLGLARAYRYPWQEGIYDGRDWISQALLILALSVNTLVVGGAALGHRPVGASIRRALAVTLLCGLVYCVASTIDYQTAFNWLLYMFLVVEVPTAILILSLLVVRSCGYRLVPVGDSKTSASAQAAAG